MLRPKLLRTLFFVLLVLVVGAGLWIVSELPDPPSEPGGEPAWRPIEVRVTPVEPGTDDGRVGALRFVSCFELESPDAAFGGFSGLLVDPAQDGARLVAVSDKGSWWRALLRFEDGVLAEVTDTYLAPIADFGGGPVLGRMRHDAEELARAEDGRLLVAFEGGHRIHAYEKAGHRGPRRHPFPPAAAKAGKNEGMEAVTRLADGRLFVAAEDFRDDEGHGRLWVGGRDGWEEASLRLVDDFLPTAAATLPDGDVLLLTRYYHPAVGVRARLSRITVEALETSLATGRPIVAEELAHLEPPLPVDNFEALDVLATTDGRVHVFVLSDDNFRDSQRTLLLQLELRERRGA